ncbi:DNA polymerase III subunit delta [Candidatus Gracilibacteria bacterium]|nr:DNA polymerase III subunit delta [Candidatus Gracilibacteria bacterium]
MIKNLILITGEDDYRLRERVRFYKKAFKDKYNEGEVEILERKQELMDLENTTFTPNLFGGRRLILLDEFWTAEKFEQAQKKEFFAKLPDFTDSSTIIVIEPSLDKRTKFSKFLLENAKVESFTPLDEVSLLEWIRKFAAEHNSKISHTCSQILLKRCGENLWNLSREIQKLSSFGTGEITEKDIMELTIPNPQAVIWDFLESLSKKSVQKSLKGFTDLIQSGVSPHEIFPMVQREIRIHAQIRDGQERNLTPPQIAQESKLHPFVVQKTFPLTKQFSQEKIKQMYDQLFEIDKRLKTGKISVSTDDVSEFELAIEKFILDVCQK